MFHLYKVLPDSKFAARKGSVADASAIMEYAGKSTTLMTVGKPKLETSEVMDGLLAVSIMRMNFM